MRAVDVSDQPQLPAPATSVQQIEQEVAAGSDELDTLLIDYEIDPKRSKPFEPVVRAKPVDSAAQGPEGEAMGFCGQRGERCLQHRAESRLRDEEIARAPKGLTIIAEGDSWFQFPYLHVTDTIGHLRRTHNILSPARAGQELRQMAADAVVHLQRVIGEFRPDAILFSGGGDDLVGFVGWPCICISLCSSL